MIDRNLFGQNIAALRKGKNLSQTALAEQLNISPQAVSKWERGINLPDLDLLLELSMLFHVSIDSLIKVEAALFCCPKCGQVLRPARNNSSYRCSNGHEIPVTDGVIDFGTFEIEGELWSQAYRNYDQYEEDMNTALPATVSQDNADCRRVKWEEIKSLRPKVIVDIASGGCYGIRHLLEHIDWPCTLIVTDLSHRILAWDRKYITRRYSNSFVKMLYVACDCAHMPLMDGCADCVTSTVGFESVMNKMPKALQEAFRILRPGGAAVYDRALLSDPESENVKAWLRLFQPVMKEHPKSFSDKHIVDVEAWKRIMKQVGFAETKVKLITEELSAEGHEVFPFRNMIIRWMAVYVCVSTK